MIVANADLWAKNLKNFSYFNSLVIGTFFVLSF